MTDQKIDELASLVAGKFRYSKKGNPLSSMTTGKQWGKICYASEENVDHAIDFGIVGLNNALVSATEASFGGRKTSDFGRKEGPTGIYEYLTEKFVSQKL